jgi:membrane protease YdiL (CAAX protease family)
VPALTAVLVPALALWNNVVVGRLSGRSYAAVNGAATGVLLATGRRAGLSWAELGLDPRRLAPGARWGAALSAPVAVGFATALGTPRLRPLVRDARVAGLARRELAFDLLVRIPVGTVLWEEVAFRGVLRAALARSFPAGATTAVGAALFGLWHVRPTLAALSANDPAREGRRAGAVTAACLGTAASGVLFEELRRRSGSLLAPALVHLATNGLGLLASAAAHRLGSPAGGGTPAAGSRSPPVRGSIDVHRRHGGEGTWGRCSTTTRWTT